MNQDDTWAPIREYTPGERRRRFPWEVGIAAIVIVGLLAWFLVPAWLGSRRAGEEKAIIDHLFKLVAAADQFFRENPDRIFVRYDEVFGPTGQLQEALVPVAGENYANLFPLRRDHPEVAVWTNDGRRVVWFMHAGPGGWIERGALIEPRVSASLSSRPQPEPKLIGEEDVIKAYREFRVAQRRDGVHVKKFPDDSRFETTYNGGMPRGAFRAYRADGKLWGEANYENGRLVGPCWNHPLSGARFDEIRIPDYAKEIRSVK